MAATKRKRRGGLEVQAKKPKKSRKDAKQSAKQADVAKEAEEEKDRISGPVCKGKWKNKERILIFSSGGINFRTRNLMQDLRMLMPHSKADTKMDHKDKLFVINEAFDDLPHYALLKEFLIQIFSTPRYHPKSQPFVDHVFTFTILDNRIWFRNFQVFVANDCCHIPEEIPTCFFHWLSVDVADDIC